MSKKFNQGERDLPLPMPLRQPFPPDEGRVPMKMTFRYESDSDEEDEAEEEVVEKEVKIEIDETEAIEMESEDVKDEDSELIQALESKILILKNNQNFQENVQENLENIRGMTPLAQYVSPNGTPRPESPKQESPRKPWADLDPSDLRWLIEGEKQRQRDLENHERMLALEREQSDDGAATGQDWVKRPKTKAKPETEPVRPGLCGCDDLCEFYGLCLNLDNYEDIIVTSPIPPRVMDFLNNTI